MAPKSPTVWSPNGTLSFVAGLQSRFTTRTGASFKTVQ